MHLALGGCLKAPPVRFGLTADTGGHIAYVLEAAQAQARLPDITVSIVTRAFDDDRLGPDYARPSQRIAPNLTIDRITTGQRAYLEKEALAKDLPAFTEAFCAHLATLPVLPVVIHAHFADAASVAIVARARLGIPFVYTPHALGIDKEVSSGADAGLDHRITAERAAIRAADAIIVSTRDEAERQIAAYGVAQAATRVHMLPPGVPQCAARAGEATTANTLDDWFADPAKPIVLAIARPVEKKNLAALVRAFLATPALADRANLVILAGQHGRGLASREERSVVAELKALCGDPRLTGRVALPPQHEAADVDALYARAAEGGLFVNPALHEPFGLTLIEAAAMGVPVVATRNGGPADILAATSHGLLVDPYDDAAIAAACLSILSDPARHAAMARSGRAAAASFDWNSYARRSTALYRALPQPPRLLASDIDNTLTGCATGALAFGQWRKAGHLPFIVATGRSFDMARVTLARWNLPEPDAYIVDVGTRIMLPSGDGGWHACARYTAAIDRDWDRAAVAALLDTLDLVPQPLETAGPHKMSFFGTEDQATAIRAAVNGATIAARVVFSHGRLIDVLAPHAGKAAAIAHYVATKGLTLAACVAAGDSGNDADMLEACGHAIVVGNASRELDILPPRDGLLRVEGCNANGVIEGLALLGFARAAPLDAAA